MSSLYVTSATFILLEGIFLTSSWPQTRCNLHLTEHDGARKIRVSLFNTNIEILHEFINWNPTVNWIVNSFFQLFVHAYKNIITMSSHDQSFLSQTFFRGGCARDILWKQFPQLNSFTSYYVLYNKRTASNLKSTWIMSSSHINNKLLIW